MSLFEDSTDELRTNLELLRRSYEASVRHYDKPSLIALASNLRYWADAKHVLHAEDPRFGQHLFTSITPGTTVKKLAKGRTYVAAYFQPGGVSTFGGGNNLFQYQGEAVKGEDEGQPCVVLEHAPGTEPNQRVINHLVYIDRPAGDVEFKNSGDKIHDFNRKKVDFSAWMNSEAARFCYRTGVGELKTVQLVHETLVRDVANNYGSTHPTMRHDSRYPAPDPDVAYLMSRWHVYELPLPYYILLKMAREVVKNFMPILQKH